MLYFSASNTLIFPRPILNSRSCARIDIIAMLSHRVLHRVASSAGAVLPLPRHTIFLRPKQPHRIAGLFTHGQSSAAVCKPNLLSLSKNPSYVPHLSVPCTMRRTSSGAAVIPLRAFSVVADSFDQSQLERTWVDKYAPSWIAPYLKLARVDRPIGTWLLLFPCLWSMSLSPLGSLPDFRLAATFCVGAFVMRGAGCTINDLWDRNFDGKVIFVCEFACFLMFSFDCLVFAGATHCFSASSLRRCHHNAGAGVPRSAADRGPRRAAVSRPLCVSPHLRLFTKHIS